MYLPVPPQPDCVSAWREAVALVDARQGHHEFNVVIDVADPLARANLTDPVVAAVDAFFGKHGAKRIETVANTIFPAALYRRHGSPLFFDRFRDNVLPKVRNKGDRWSGYYFERMMQLPQLKGEPINQLSDIIRRLKDPSISALNKFELSVFDPARDVDDSPYGGQCLSFASFKPIGDAIPSAPENATVRIEPTKAEARQADRTVDAVARANGGHYSVDLHLRHDPTASEAYVASHVRRLEAMRRAGAGPERHLDGSWSISHDHLDRAEAFAQRQQRDRPVALSILSSRPVGDLVVIEAPTWLDRELASGTSVTARDAGFGREVRTALASRRQWLVEQQLATGDGQAFRLRNGALESLRQREIREAGQRLSKQLRKRFEPASIGERIQGVVARRVDLESGSYALVERSRDFTLVPWRDMLERNIGKSASGILRSDGISWQFGRGRSGPAIS